MSLNDNESAPLLGAQNETRNQVDVDWVWERDAQNPLNWSSRAKWGHVAIVSVLSFLVQVQYTNTKNTHHMPFNLILTLTITRAPTPGPLARPW